MELPVGVGDLVAGKYRVEERIGSGAMGVVFAARHVELGERVALKFLNPIYGANEVARSRFSREAKNTFSLKSEHVARVLDVGKLDAGDPYIVMEFLDGRTLRAHVEEHGRLPREETISIVHQICEGVAEAHARGIVHRDLKPENVFLAKLPNGASLVKVLDFGISKVTEESKAKGGAVNANSELAITSQDQVLGTPRYMAPEQVAKSGNVSTESDVWSLGVLAYWLLSGQVPFDGGSPQMTLVKLLSKDLAPDIATLVPDLDPALARVVMKCLERTPSDRFPDADALRRALRPFARSSIAITKREVMPPTKRSAANPDIPTLDEPASPRVVEAVIAPETIRETDRLPEPSTQESLPLELAAPANQKPNDTAPILAAATAPAPAPAPEAAPQAGQAAAPKVDTRTTQRRVTLRTSDAPSAKPSGKSPSEVKAQTKTLPLGMVYSTAPADTKTDTKADTKGSTQPMMEAHPESPQEEELVPDRIPMKSAGRTRTFLVLGFFAFVFLVVWMLKSR